LGLQLAIKNKGFLVGKTRICGMKSCNSEPEREAGENKKRKEKINTRISSRKCVI